MAVEPTMSVNTIVASSRFPASFSATAMARPLPPHSTVTHGSSPTTHLSWSGGISNTVFGPMSRVSPSAIATRTAP